MIHISPKSNFANKVRNTILPRTKPLMPLFETISNSIHAIKEAKDRKLIENDGDIRITIIRNGDAVTLKMLDDIEEYPIKSIIVTDNGIGLNDENLNYFAESDTDHKIEIGGKGVGRFVCLKAFEKIAIESCFETDGKRIIRTFEFKPTKEGFHSFEEFQANDLNSIGTKITLVNLKEEYKKNAPKNLTEIAREIIYQALLIQYRLIKFASGSMRDKEDELSQMQLST